MKFKRMEYLGVVVDDLEAGVQRFSEVFGLDFDILAPVEVKVEAEGGVMPDPKAPPHAFRAALDGTGAFMLLEIAGVDEGFRSIHFRVDNLEEAVAELSGKGLRPLHQPVLGNMKEAIFAAEDLYGIRVCLLEYPGSSLAAATRAESLTTPDIDPGSAMRFQRMEYLGVVVDDLEAGVQRFSEVFGLDFDILDPFDILDSVEVKVEAEPSGRHAALDSTGVFQLAEIAGAEEGFRNIHFRVDNLEEAVAELSGKGLRLLHQPVLGNMKEAIFAPEDLYGIRVCLLEYPGSSLAAATRKESSA